MHGTLIAFRLKPPQDPNEASKLVKKLYGQNTSSHKGRYQYRRKGLLDEIPAHKLIRGVIVIREKDEERILAFLKEYDTEIFVRKVKLTDDDLRELGIR